MAKAYSEKDKMGWQNLSGQMQTLILKYRELNRAIDAKAVANEMAEKYVDNQIGDGGCLPWGNGKSSQSNTYKEIDRVRSEIAKLIHNRPKAEKEFIEKEIGVSLSGVYDPEISKNSVKMDSKVAADFLDSMVKKTTVQQKPKVKPSGKMSLSEFLGKSVDSVAVNVVIEEKPQQKVLVNVRSDSQDWRQSSRPATGRFSNLK